MNEKVSRLVSLVKAHLLTRYGERIKGFLLYGSHARNEATENSDIDLLVLVDDSVEPSEVRRSLSDLLFDILLEHGELVSVLVLPISFFEESGYPFILNVKREGIRV